MSDESKADFGLEDGIGNLQDGADGLFGQVPAMMPSARAGVVPQPKHCVTLLLTSHCLLLPPQACSA